MIKSQLLFVKKWYEERGTRERLLLFLLSWSFLYAVFSLFLLTPLENQRKALHEQTNLIRNQINTWNKQIEDLNQLAQSSVYKQWTTQRLALQRLRQQYNYLVQNNSASQWREMITAILNLQSNITIAQLRDFPETPYNPNNMPSIKPNIYQRKIALTIYSNYVDTITYLEHLEKLLPNIHWDSLNYEVAQYPLAKVDLEFSILYEKIH